MGKKRRFEYGNYPTITMECFLTNFVFPNGYVRAINTVTGEVINFESIGDINHYDIDELAIEGVERASWDETTKDKLLKGEILLVSATSWKGKGTMIIPYKRPQIVLQDGYACALQKESFENNREIPLPNSYSLRRKVLRKKR